MKKIIASLLVCLGSQSAMAQVSATLEYDFPMGATLELGKNMENSYIYGSASYSELIFLSMNRYELGFYLPTNETKTHNFGLSAGMLSVDGDDDSSLFEGLDDEASVISGKYGYYPQGIDNSSWKIEAEVIMGDFDGVAGSLGVGYKFNF